MPSTAFSAMRAKSTAGSSSSVPRAPRVHAIAVPAASDRSAASSVTAFAVMPAAASALVNGRSSPWKAGLSS